ncbi:MAG: response regulator transcription factor [Eubacteriales bacterium]|nr:response regulator transcription factor [Eubacteriales bacterium]
MSQENRSLKPNILIVEDQFIIKQAIENTLNQTNQFHIVASIDNASHAEAYCKGRKIDLIIMDVYTAQRENGLEYSKKIKAAYPSIKIMIATSMPEHSFIEKAISYGCDSFWYKDSGLIEFLSILERTLAGEKIFPENTPELEIGFAKSTEFTARELEILRELMNGYSPQEIAEHLNIAKVTVHFHINNLLSKTGYDNKVKLIIDIADKKFIIPGF